MTRQEFKQYNEAAVQGTISDKENPAFIFSTCPVKLLSQIAKGEIDCQQLALRMLEAYGMNKDGQWVGFKQSELLNNKVRTAPRR